MSVRKLTLAALLTALSVVMTRLIPTTFLVVMLGMSPDTVRIALGIIPIFIASIMLGAPYGAAVAGLADFVGYLINPMGGAFIYPITIAAILGGAVPGLLTRRGDNPLWRVTVAVVVGALADSIFKTFAFVLWFSTPPFPLLWMRLFVTFVMCLGYVPAVWLLLKTAERTMKLPIA